MEKIEIEYFSFMDLLTEYLRFHDIQHGVVVKRPGKITYDPENTRVAEYVAEYFEDWPLPDSPNADREYLVQPFETSEKAVACYVSTPVSMELPVFLYVDSNIIAYRGISARKF